MHSVSRARWKRELSTSTTTTCTHQSFPSVDTRSLALAERTGAPSLSTLRRSNLSMSRWETSIVPYRMVIKSLDTSHRSTLSVSRRETSIVPEKWLLSQLIFRICIEMGKLIVNGH